MADAPLTPELALDYLRELSTDIRSAVVLDAGRLAAAGPYGDAQRNGVLHELVVELFARADAATGERARSEQVEVTLPGGAVFAVRGGRFALAVVANRYALPSLMFYDLRSVLHDLGDAAP